MAGRAGRICAGLAGLALGMLALAAPPSAQTAAEAATTPTEARFTVTIAGLRAAELAMQATVTRTGYAAAGNLRSTGLIGLVAPITYQAEVQGRRSGPRFQPRRYTEAAFTGDRRSAGVMEYRGRTPLLKRYDPPRSLDPYGLNPATQAGTVDPMTAIFATLRDQPLAELCRLQLQVFDGARRSQVTVTAPVRQGDRIACAGEYRRVDGFPPESMAERQSFPFRVTYAPTGQGDLWQVAEIETDTTFGRARITRK